jgi:hypothetical protein
MPSGRTPFLSRRRFELLALDLLFTNEARREDTRVWAEALRARHRHPERGPRTPRPTTDYSQGI